MVEAEESVRCVVIIRIYSLTTPPVNNDKPNLQCTKGEYECIVLYCIVFYCIVYWSHNIDEKLQIRNRYSNNIRTEETYEY